MAMKSHFNYQSVYNYPRLLFAPFSLSGRGVCLLTYSPNAPSVRRGAQALWFSFLLRSTGNEKEGRGTCRLAAVIVNGFFSHDLTACGFLLWRKLSSWEIDIPWDTHLRQERLSLCKQRLLSTYHVYQALHYRASKHAGL